MFMKASNLVPFAEKERFPCTIELVISSLPNSKATLTPGTSEIFHFLAHLGAKKFYLDQKSNKAQSQSG